MVDLDGAVLLPGLVDAHVHLEQWAAARRRIDVSTARSAAEAAAMIAAAVRSAAVEPDTVVMGHGFRDALWSAPPGAALLDDVLPGRAVVVASGDLHTAWCSTAAVRRFALSSPDGVVVEQEAMELMARAGAVSPAVLDGWVLEAAAAAAARGVTAVVDLEYGDLLASWARRAARCPAGHRCGWPPGCGSTGSSRRSRPGCAAVTRSPGCPTRWPPTASGWAR